MCEPPSSKDSNKPKVIEVSVADNSLGDAG